MVDNQKISAVRVFRAVSLLDKTRPAWAGFKTAEEGIAIIMSYIL